MPHIEAIKLLVMKTGMGELAAINNYQIKKRMAEDRRRGSRGMRPVISTNFLK